MIKDPETGQEVPDSYRGTDFADLDYKVTVQAVKATAMTKAYVAEQAKQLLDLRIITPDEYMEAIEFPGKDKIIQRLKSQQAFPPEMLEALKQIPPQDLVQFMQSYLQPPEEGGFSMPQQQPMMG